MLDLVGNPEDWFSHNEAHIGYLKVPISEISRLACHSDSLFESTLTSQQCILTLVFQIPAVNVQRLEVNKSML